jgi:hypothetical protein
VPMERLYSEGLQANIHSFRAADELIAAGDIFAAYVIITPKGLIYRYIPRDTATWS